MRSAVWPSNFGAQTKLARVDFSLISDAVSCWQGCWCGLRWTSEPRIDSMDCPVCLASAKNTTPPQYGGLVVECRHCGIFRLTRDALAAFPSLRVAERLAALLTAKRVVSPRVVPTISTGCLKLDRSKA